MTLYTAMPLELVLDGIQQQPGPFVEVTRQGVTMQLLPVSPGLGKIVRLLSAPLDRYLLPEYAPGCLVSYGSNAEDVENPQMNIPTLGF